MKTIKLLLAIVTVAALNLKFANLNCNAQTSIPAGNVSGTWTLAGSPYNVQGSIQILDGTTLTIEPGVTVNFQGTYKLNVQGRLLAIGSVADTIIFTAVNTTNGWRGIRFDNTPATNDTSRIVYCKLQFGKATGSLPDNNGGAVYFNNFSKTIISYCRVSDCAANLNGGGIYCDNSSPIILYNNITNNIASSSNGGGGGLYCNGSNPSISNNSICNNTASAYSGGGGGIFCSSSNPSISNNFISNNAASGNYGSGGGIYCFGGSNPTINNNIITNNIASSGGGILLLAQCSPTITNNIISNNTVSGSSGGGGGVLSSASTPTITNNVISNNSVSGGTDGGEAFFAAPTIQSLQTTLL